VVQAAFMEEEKGCETSRKEITWKTKAQMEGF
jgi:hypothetical protein